MGGGSLQLGDRGRAHCRGRGDERVGKHEGVGAACVNGDVVAGGLAGLDRVGGRAGGAASVIY